MNTSVKTGLASRDTSRNQSAGRSVALSLSYVYHPSTTTRALHILPHPQHHALARCIQMASQVRQVPTTNSPSRQEATQTNSVTNPHPPVKTSPSFQAANSTGKQQPGKRGDSKGRPDGQQSKGRCLRLVRTALLAGPLDSPPRATWCERLFELFGYCFGV
jgi:hypothetical protein